MLNDRNKTRRFKEVRREKPLMEEIERALVPLTIFILVAGSAYGSVSTSTIRPAAADPCEAR
jgi:hypothetical protein